MQTIVHNIDPIARTIAAHWLGRIAATDTDAELDAIQATISLNELEYGDCEENVQSLIELLDRIAGEIDEDDEEYGEYLDTIVDLNDQLKGAMADYQEGLKEDREAWVHGLMNEPAEQTEAYLHGAKVRTIIERFKSDKPTDKTELNELMNFLNQLGVSDEQVIQLGGETLRKGVSKAVYMAIK